MTEKTILTEVKKHGSVQAFIVASLAAIDVRALRRPTRAPEPTDLVLGEASEAIMRLVGVYRQVKEIQAPIGQEMQAFTGRVTATTEEYNKTNKTTALVRAMQDPTLLRAAQRYEQVEPAYDAGRHVLTMIRNLITTEIEVAFKVPEDVEAEIDNRWRVVAPAKSTGSGLPPELAAMLGSALSGSRRSRR